MMGLQNLTYRLLTYLVPTNQHNIIILVETLKNISILSSQ